MIKFTFLGVFVVANHESDIHFVEWGIRTRIYQENRNYYQLRFNEFYSQLDSFFFKIWLYVILAC